MKKLLISPHVPNRTKKNHPGPAERPETTNKRAQTTDLRPVQKKLIRKQVFLQQVVRKKVRNPRPETKDQSAERPETTNKRPLIKDQRPETSPKNNFGKKVFRKKVGDQRPETKD